ncbi:centrobin [Culex pipiens pallens]|uniref:centrobin n=1 Tax=Culex pipiens pallens TaxID=42434 RepID=UPI0019534A6D|nr:centrobin [Culex pipiens pallens]
MSDSDDTDVLLLIPPDFFNVGATASVTPIPAGLQAGIPRTLDISFAASCSGSQSYKSSLVTMSGGHHQRNGYFREGGNGYGYHLPDGANMYYSTPLKGHLGGEPPKDQFLLNEIDKFLQVGGEKGEGQQVPVKSAETSLIDMNSVSLNDFPSLTASDFNGFAKPNVPQKPPRRELMASRTSIGSRPPMLSLNEIWNSNAINQESSKVQEERLRRQHCERNIQALQSKLLEYEQKLAVAIDVDKEKEGMIVRQEEEILRLTQQCRDLELRHADGQEKLLQENLEAKNKTLFLEKELADTISVVRRLQDKNDALETKLEGLTTASRDVTDVHKNQLKDLEIRLGNSRESERGLKEQLGKVRKSYEQLRDEFEVERKKAEEGNKLRADFASLKVKTDNLSRKFAEISGQNESYKKQIEDLKAQIATHMEEKKNLLKELDVQRLSLKKYYQAQLEDVVGDKLKEFQHQLLTVEDQLKSDAKKKERLLAERAIKQIELINETNEQEIKLLNEKYSEQEALYRLQLTNSSKTIHELEDKLSTYQNRRADIAEQLHTIMETQWQKALQVLTSPSPQSAPNDHHFNRLSVDHIDKDQLDGVRTLKSVAENETFQTPVSNGRRQLPRDLLHNYIELLLEKSPCDLRDLEGVLAGGRKQQQQQNNGKKVSPQTSGNGKVVAATQSSANLSQLSRTIGKTARPWK